MIDTMIQEYTDLAAHISRFKKRWYDNVVAIEGHLHLTPQAFAFLRTVKGLGVETTYSGNNIHMSINDNGIRYVCVISGEIIPPKDEVPDGEHN